MLPVFYATHDGHTKHIAQAVAERLCEHGLSAEAVDVKARPVTAEELAGLPLVILIAAIRYGFHLPQAGKALEVYSALSRKPPLALASVNLTARKPERSTAETNPYLAKWIRRRKLTPTLAMAFPGKLNYPRYRLWETLAMQLIMTMSGGVTDRSAVIDYTDWARVSEWADQIAAYLARGTADSAVE